MSEILKFLFGGPNTASRADTTANSPDPDPNDVWAFTDPDAKDDYTRRGRLKHLEHDIHYEVMRGGPWQPEELEYKSEMRQLLREGIVADKGTYWYRSPHPTVYRAQRDGALSVAGKIYRFQAGDDLVFLCRMERDQARDESSPVLIARLQSVGEARLCGEMSGAMKGMGRQM